MSGNHRGRNCPICGNKSCSLPCRSQISFTNMQAKKIRQFRLCGKCHSDFVKKKIFSGHKEFLVWNGKVVSEEKFDEIMRGIKSEIEKARNNG